MTKPISVPPQKESGDDGGNGFLSALMSSERSRRQSTMSTQSRYLPSWSSSSCKSFSPRKRTRAEEEESVARLIFSVKRSRSASWSLNDGEELLMSGALDAEDERCEVEGCVVRIQNDAAPIDSKDDTSNAEDGKNSERLKRHPEEAEGPSISAESLAEPRYEDENSEDTKAAEESSSSNVDTGEWKCRDLEGESDYEDEDQDSEDDDEAVHRGYDDDVRYGRATSSGWL
ncbi:Hypothetical predicted protein [Lecanosticta acicola]|uniref:Uncharacterized protein n=1 Tax=Lecanosticta acicola TaxID=111012 RepID=A0AAI8Z1V9_9PEZI|nr:Hypothetical predicted protein [Lecanosticta acicola]